VSEETSKDLLLVEYQSALLDACLLYGVPFEPLEPRKTLALLAEAILKEGKR
jgi:hypothetical protein